MGFQIAEAYVDLKARNLMADALASAVTQIRGVGAEAEAVGAKSSATGLLGSKAFLAIGAAAAGTVVGLTKMAGDFEASTTRLVTSAGESERNLGMIRQGILDMAGAVGYSAEELSTALYKIESGGQHGADGLKVLQAAAEGAKTENADLTVVADAVTSAMQDYHLKADDAATVTSKLVAATSAGKMTFQELAGSMSAILPVASANHVSLNDILGDLASMTVHGMSAEQASQNLADAIRHMASPTQQMSKELAVLGLNATDISAKLGERGLSGTVQLISQAIQQHMGPESTMVVLNLATALKGLPAPVQALGQRVLDGSMSMKDFTKAARDLNVLSDKQVTSFSTLAGSFHTIGTQSLSGAQVMQSYAGALNKAMGDATGLNVALMLTGENSATTANAIKTVSDATAQADGHVRGWDEIQKTFNQKLSEAKDGLGALGITIGTYFLPIATKLTGAIAEGVTWISKHHDVAIVLAGVIGGAMVAAFAALAVAIWTAVAPFVPLAAAITAIIAVGGLLITHWGDIKRIAGDVFGFIGDFITGTWNNVSHVSTTVWDGITGYLSRLWQAHKDQAIASFGPTADFIINEWHRTQNDTTTVWNAISSFFSAIWGTIHNTAVTMWNAIANFLSPSMNSFRGTFGGIWNGIVGDFQGIWGRITGIAQAVWNDVTNAFRTGINQVIGVANRFVIDDIDAILKFFLITPIKEIPTLASGGTVGSGFQTNGPVAIVGEGNPSHPEYVIPTDPAHRSNALALYQSLGAQLMAEGGILGSFLSGGAGALNSVVDKLASAIAPGVFRDIAAGLGHKAVSGLSSMVSTALAAMSGGADMGPATTNQMDHVREIIEAAKERGIGHAGAVIAIMTGLQESGVRILANPNVPASLGFWHEGLGYDHDSVGIFQQRQSGWGTLAERMNARASAGMFFNKLGRGPYGDYGAAAQRVQVSAFPGAYSKWQGKAEGMVTAAGYDSGGLLPTGFSHVYNGTGRPEAVFTSAQMDALTKNRSQHVTVNVIQQSGSPQETGRAVALALRTVA